MKRTEISAIVREELKDASQFYLEEIVSHGIHNLTNQFNGDNGSDYAAFRDEFLKQATELLNADE